MEEVSRNILKYMVRSKSLQHHVVIIHDTETMIAETDDQSKLEELRKNMHKLYSKKTWRTYTNRVCIGCLLFRWY